MVTTVYYGVISMKFQMIAYKNSLIYQLVYWVFTIKQSKTKRLYEPM